MGRRLTFVIFLVAAAQAAGVSSAARRTPSPLAPRDLAPRSESLGIDLELVGQIGGAEVNHTNTMALREGRLLVGLGPRLAVADLRAPAEPSFVAQSEILPRSIRALALDEDLAFVALADAGVAILDLGDPPSPRLLRIEPTDAEAWAVAVDKERLLVTTDDRDDGRDSTLLVYDRAGPALVRLRASLDLPGRCRSLVVREGRAFVGCAYAGLQIVDLQGVGGPEIVARWPFGENMSDIGLLGELVVLPYGFDLDLVSVAPDGRVQRVAHMDLPDIPKGIAIEGQRIYVALKQNSSPHSILVIDARKPSEPRIEGALRTSGRPIDLVLGEGLAYATFFQKGQPENDYLGLIDVSSPAQPRWLGGVDTVGRISVVAARGRMVYAGHNGIAGQSRLHAIDVDDPARPVVLDTLDGVLEELWDIAVDGDRLYLADEIAGLHVVDASDPRRLRLVASLPLGEKALAVDAEDGLAYVATGSGRLYVIDARGIASLEILSSLAFEEGLWSVAVSGDSAYVGLDGHGIRIVDLSDPARPETVGNIALPVWPAELEVVGSHLFVYSSGSVLAVDVSDPGDPRVVDWVDLPQSSWGMAIEPPYLFVAERGARNAARGGLRVYDISDPAALREIGELDTPGEASGVAAADGLAFVAESYSGMSIVRVGQAQQDEGAGPLHLPLLQRGTRLGGFPPAPEIVLQIADHGGLPTPPFIQAAIQRTPWLTVNADGRYIRFPDQDMLRPMQGRLQPGPLATLLLGLVDRGGFLDYPVLDPGPRCATDGSTTQAMLRWQGRQHALRSYLMTWVGKHPDRCPLGSPGLPRTPANERFLRLAREFADLDRPLDSDERPLPIEHATIWARRPDGLGDLPPARWPLARSIESSRGRDRLDRADLAILAAAIREHEPWEGAGFAVFAEGGVSMAVALRVEFPGWQAYCSDAKGCGP